MPIDHANQRHDAGGSSVSSTAFVADPPRIPTSACRAALLPLTILCFAASAAPARAQESTNRGTDSQQAPNASNAQLHVVHVQGKVYMIAGAGGNISLQVGDDGILLVDSGLASMSDKVVEAIRSVSGKPIRYIINTHIHQDHTGGNQAIGKLGSTVTGGNVVGNIGASAGEGATIVAFQSILDRMSDQDSKDKAPEKAWPTDAYTGAEKKMFFNGEAIEVIHQPAAHTDGDSIVFFRRSDVVSTGDIFSTTNYPIIDLQRGGSIQGIIDGLNRLIYQVTIPAEKQEGGTMVIPGHGRICDQADVVYYQEMVIIIRDRIRDMINKGMTLDEIKQSRPTRDYDGLYGSDKGFWTTDMFVSAVYQSLKDQNQKAQK